MIRSLRAFFINAGLVLASSALALAAGEGALRLLNKPAWDSGFRAGWRYQGTDRHVNELGYRGQPIPVVTHIDYSARIRTVHVDTNPRYYRLLSENKRRTGCPVLVADGNCKQPIRGAY